MPPTSLMRRPSSNGPPRNSTELNLGATAVGTGLNAGDDYTRAAIANLARYTGLPLRAAANRFRVTQSMGDVLAYSGALRRLSVETCQDRVGPAPPQHGAACRHRRDPAPGGAAGLVDHAGQGESVGA